MYLMFKMGCGVSSMMIADRMEAPSPAGRVIHPTDDIQYPSSPSFRIYFKQNTHSQGEIDGVKSMSYSPRTSSITKVSKKEKDKEGKKKISRKVTPKHILNMGYCCSAQNLSFHRLPEKPMA